MDLVGEQVWVCVNVKGSRSLLAEGIYRPNIDDIQGLEYFKTAVTRNNQYIEKKDEIEYSFNLVNQISLCFCSGKNISGNERKESK